MTPDNIDPTLTETRTITVTLYGNESTDFEAVLEGIEGAMSQYDDTGTELDWNIDKEG
jgi:hypothetical protein